MRVLIGIAVVILPFLCPGSGQGGSDRKVHPNA